jgi:hypothetical protein
MICGAGVSPARKGADLRSLEKQARRASEGTGACGSPQAYHGRTANPPQSGRPAPTHQVAPDSAHQLTTSSSEARNILDSFIARPPRNIRDKSLHSNVLRSCARAAQELRSCAPRNFDFGLRGLVPAFRLSDHLVESTSAGCRPHPRHPKAATSRRTPKPHPRKIIPALQTNSGHFPAPRQLTAAPLAPTLSRPKTSAPRPRRNFFCQPQAKRTRLVRSGAAKLALRLTVAVITFDNAKAASAARITVPDDQVRLPESGRRSVDSPGEGRIGAAHSLPVP